MKYPVDIEAGDEFVENLKKKAPAIGGFNGAFKIPDFEDFDPFGDFYLIFGSQKLCLKMVEIPIRYKARVHGETQISRFTHGLLLIKMLLVAFFRIKAI